MINNNESTTSNTRSSQPFMPATQAMSGNTGSSKSSDNKIKNPHRTKAKAGDTAKIPTKLPIITTPAYQNALSFIKNASAYLQPLSDTSNLKYSAGTFLYNGLPATQEKINPLYTNENIEAFNLPLLMALYGIILDSSPLSDGWDYDRKITIYFPEFAKKIRKSNISRKDFEECIDNIHNFQTVIGIIGNGTNGNDILPVISYVGWDAQTHTISFSSPYMMKLIQDIHEASIRKNKKGQPLFKKNGEPLMLPSHSYLVDMSIVSEKNKKALEIVFVIIALIEQAGNGTPNIRADTIISRCPRLHKSLAGQSAGNKNNLLKRAFSKAWDLLREKTTLTTVYNNIQLPNAKDITDIPTSSTLSHVFEFPHNGKGQRT